MFYRFKIGSNCQKWGKIVQQDSFPNCKYSILSSRFYEAKWCSINEDFIVNTSETFCPAMDDNFAQVLPPVNQSNMGVIWATGLNYRKHAEEVGMDPPRFPITFVKTTNTLSGPFDPILKPKVVSNDELDYEAELAIVIGKKCKNVKPEDAMKCVLGFTAANDVSARKWQGKKGGGQWCRSKCYDTFLPLGPGILTTNCADIDPQNLSISSTLIRNNASTTMQNSNTRDMIFRICELISFISQDTTLFPFTVILTGTPEGVGLGKKPPVFLQPGDIIRVAVENIGTISNIVLDSDSQ